MFRLLLIATAATPPQKPHLIPDSIGISTLSGAVELVVARSELPVARGAALTLGSAAQRNLNVTVVGGAGAPTRLNIASAALRFSDEPIDGWRVPAVNMRLAVDAMGEQVIVTLTPPAGRASFTNVAAFSAAFNVLRSFDTLDADGDGVLDWEEAGAWDAPRLGGEVRGGGRRAPPSRRRRELSSREAIRLVAEGVALEKKLVAATAETAASKKTCAAAVTALEKRLAAANADLEAQTTAHGSTLLAAAKTKITADSAAEREATRLATERVALEKKLVAATAETAASKKTCATAATALETKLAAAKAETAASKKTCTTPAAALGKKLAAATAETAASKRSCAAAATALEAKRAVEAQPSFAPVLLRALYFAGGALAALFVRRLCDCGRRAERVAATAAAARAREARLAARLEASCARLAASDAERAAERDESQAHFDATLAAATARHEATDAVANERHAVAIERAERECSEQAQVIVDRDAELAARQSLCNRLSADATALAAELRDAKQGAGMVESSAKRNLAAQRRAIVAAEARFAALQATHAALGAQHATLEIAAVNREIELGDTRRGLAELRQAWGERIIAETKRACDAMRVDVEEEHRMRFDRLRQQLAAVERELSETSRAKSALERRTAAGTRAQLSQIAHLTQSMAHLQQRQESAAQERALPPAAAASPQRSTAPPPADVDPTTPQSALQQPHFSPPAAAKAPPLLPTLSPTAASSHFSPPFSAKAPTPLPTPFPAAAPSATAAGMPPTTATPRADAASPSPSTPSPGASPPRGVLSPPHTFAPPCLTCVLTFLLSSSPPPYSCAAAAPHLMIGGVDVEELKRSIQSAARMSARGGLLYTPGSKRGVERFGGTATPHAGSLSRWAADADVDDL